MWCPPFLVAPPMWWWELDNIRSYVRFIIEMFCVHGKANSWFVILGLVWCVSCPSVAATTWPRDKQSWQRCPAPPQFVTVTRDLDTDLAPGGCTTGHTRHGADTADQLVEFVLHFFMYSSHKIGEITHFTFFQITFPRFWILNQQDAWWVLSSSYFECRISTLNSDNIWRHNATE